MDNNNIQQGNQFNAWYDVNVQNSPTSNGLIMENLDALTPSRENGTIHSDNSNNMNNNISRQVQGNDLRAQNMISVPHGQPMNVGFRGSNSLQMDLSSNEMGNQEIINNSPTNISISNNINDTNTNALAEINNISLAMDVQSMNLEAHDMNQVYFFQETLQSKIAAYLNTIEDRRSSILKEIEQDNNRLRSMNIENSPQVIDFLNKLQTIRLRAIETETIEIQKLRLKFLTIIDQYKNAMNVYCKNIYEGKRSSNPTPMFQQWADSLDPDITSGVAKGSQELSSISRKIVSALLNAGHNNDVTETTSTSIFPLKNLPSEILHLVLDKLSHKSDIVSLLTVCKLWAQLIVKILYYRPHINKRHQLELFIRTMRHSSEETIFDYRSMIKRLNFSFVGDYMHDEELSNFIGCRNLERLTLVFCKHITSNSISEVLKCCRYLQSIDITGIKEISDNIFEILADNCPRLQGFYVPQAKNVTFLSLNNFIVNAPILKRVKVTANNNMNDELVELLADKCPMLVEVDITLSPNVHDSSLLKLFTKLGQLREFRITHNTNISDKFLMELSKNVTSLPALRLLDFSGCENITDKTIERIVSLAPKLRNVFLGKCSRITDTSLFNLAKLGKNLQTVHFGHCFNITDQGVRSLVQSCPRIQYVDFACCTNLSNRTLYELSDLTKLKRIGLVKCSQMTDEGLLNMISLRGRNDSLERVHLSYCSNLTIYPIYELLMACPRLSHLSLTAVPSFLRPDITAFCRPAPADFSENQRQIFCVFSGKGVHKLRHYLMSLTTPTNGPQTSIREVLSKYIVSKNMLKQNEDLEEGILRITSELNQDSSAILAAAGLSQMNGVNNDLLFQNIDFERLDSVFNWHEVSFDHLVMSSNEINHLLSLVDKKFCEDPFDEEYDESEGTVAPGTRHNLNSEFCHIVRKFHELDDRVDDFEVNVASLARVQFQFTGFLLHEMVHIHMQMIELNRQITEIQRNVLQSGIESDIKGVSIWRLLFTEKFTELLRKFKLSTVVLRLYLKDSITLLTRQRELILAHQRNAWDNIGGEEADNNNRPNILDQVGVMPLSTDELNMLQFRDLRAAQLGNELRPSLSIDNNNQLDIRSETPDDDTILEDA